ncbi:sulfatase [Verrucomicrobiota bacterium]
MKNVVLLTIDTLRKDVLGCYGNKDNLTPFLDSIKDKSTVFTKAHSVAPYTQASFPGILTSSYLFDYPLNRNLSPKRTLISEALRKKDIQTAGFHSNPYLCSFFGWNRGWNHYYDSMDDDVSDMCPYIDGETINKKADAWLSSNTTGDYKPFFMWVHYMDVHEPYIPARKYVEKVDQSINKSDDELFKLFQDVLLKRDTSNPEIVELFRKLYHAHVCQVDEYTGMLIDVLKKNNVLEDTTVIITTDHGDEFGDHGSLSHDGKFFSELVNIPLVIYNHESANGQNIDTLVSGLDTSPTILDMFGLDPEENFQGQSLLPLENYPEKPCFGESVGKLSHKIKETDKPAYFCRDKDMKIMYREEDDKWEMYDLSEDPAEKNNIIDTSPQADEMKAKLKPRIKRETK